MKSAKVQPPARENRIYAKNSFGAWDACYMCYTVIVVDTRCIDIAYTENIARYV